MIRYLTERHLVRMNVILIQTYSPDEMIGVRDYGILNMIVSQPKQEIFDEEIYRTLQEKAAILFINIIQKHPFQNGNKRTAFMAVDTFLKLNDFEFRMSAKDKIEMTVEVATYRGEFDNLKDDISSLIGKYVHQIIIEE